ncbi:MAG: hypothetical protein ACC742_14700 [Thermoanaerobaculales bacterium]
MNRKSRHSLHPALGICIFAVCTIVLTTGTARAQQVILENSMLRIESGGSVEVVRLDSGGDLVLGGPGWFGDITSYRGSDGTVFVFNAATADLTLGGASAGTPQTGDLFLKDNDGTTNTIVLNGLTAQIILGNSASTEDGDILVRDTDGTSSITMDGASGNVSNQFAGNGLVKAWARINSDGTVASCWNCSTNAANTQKLFTGQYEVDFTFASDITARPRAGILDTHGTLITAGEIYLANRLGDNSSVWVGTLDSAGTSSDRAFTIMIY